MIKRQVRPKSSFQSARPVNSQTVQAGAFLEGGMGGLNGVGPSFADMAVEAPSESRGRPPYSERFTAHAFLPGPSEIPVPRTLTHVIQPFPDPARVIQCQLHEDDLERLYDVLSRQYPENIVEGALEYLSQNYNSYESALTGIQRAVEEAFSNAGANEDFEMGGMDESENYDEEAYYRQQELNAIAYGIDQLATEVEETNHADLSEDTKKICHDSLAGNPPFEDLDEDTVDSSYQTFLTNVNDKLIHTAVNNSGNSKDVCDDFIDEGYNGAQRIKDGIDEAVQQQNHAYLSGYIYQVQATLPYFNNYLLQNIEMGFGNYPTRYLDIRLIGNHLIEVKKFGDNPSQQLRNSFENQVRAYAANIGNNLPGSARMEYQFDTSAHNVPQWALDILRTHAHLFPNGLYVNNVWMINGQMVSNALNGRNLNEVSILEIVRFMASRNKLSDRFQIAQAWVQANQEEQSMVADLVRQADRN